MKMRDDVLERLVKDRVKPVFVSKTTTPQVGQFIEESREQRWLARSGELERGCAPGGCTSQRGSPTLMESRDLPIALWPLLVQTLSPLTLLPHLQIFFFF